MVEDTQVAPASVYAPGHEHLSGTYPRTLDEKLRLVLPAGGRWRELFAAGARLGPYAKRLALWTQRSWEEVTGELRTQDRMGLLPAGAYNDFVASFFEVGLDAQGRLVLPESLRRYAGIGDKGAEVVVVGVGHHAEIWDAGARDRDLAGRDPDAAANWLEDMKF